MTARTEMSTVCEGVAIDLGRLEARILLPLLWHVDDGLVIDVITQHLVENQGSIPFLEVVHGRIAVRKVLRGGAIRNYAFLDRLALLPTLDDGLRLRHAQHREQVHSHHLQLPLEASADDCPADDRRNVFIIEVQVQGLSNHLEVFVVLHFDKLCVFFFLVEEDRRELVLVAGWTASAAAGAGVLELPLFTGVRLKVAVFVPSLIIDELREIDFASNHKLIHDTRLNSAEALPHLRMIYSLIPSHCLHLLRDEDVLLVSIDVLALVLDLLVAERVGPFAY